MMEDTVYMTLPGRATTDSEKRQAILEYLQRYPRQFFTGKEIASETGFSTKQTCPELRQAITELIHFDKVPIVANHAGFAFTDEPNMVKKYIEHLTFRAQGLQRRIRDMEEIVARMTTAQIQDYAVRGTINK